MQGRNPNRTAQTLYVAITCASFWVTQATAAADVETTDRGRLRYEEDCAGCHGVSANGDGAVANVLTIKPSDLTVLTAGNRGEFPEDYVRRVIDGRELPPDAHGHVAMPVWGRHYQRSTLSYSEKGIQERISELVAYLRSIQSDSGLGHD